MNVTNLVPKSSVAATNELRDIRPPVEIPSGWAWVWWVVAALAFIMLAWWVWRYWQRKKSVVPVVPVIPPHVRARQKLEQALALLGQPREFCILVSDAIRWYLEERFQFRAPERTTEEFLHELQATPLLSASQKSSLSDFLARCDLVKFARYEPGEAELRDLHASALRLIEETEPRPAPPEIPGSGQSPTPTQSGAPNPAPEPATSL